MRTNIFAFIRQAVALFALIQLLTAASALAQVSLLDLPLPLNTWRFNDTNWLSAMRDAPKSFGNLQNPASWERNALLLDSLDPAWIEYNIVESDGWTNILCNRGTIHCWFNPNWSSVDQGGAGPGDWGRFIDIGMWSSNALYGWWSLYLNPEGNAIYFSAQTNGAAADFLSAPISWASNEWHFIALTYSATNCALYLDGDLAATGDGVTLLPSPDVLTNGFFIGSDNSGLAQARGQFENLRTWNQPFTAGELSYFYTGTIDRVWPRPASLQTGGSMQADSPSGPPVPPGDLGDSGGDASGPQTYPTNSLWLEILPPGTNFITLDTNSAAIIVHGTIPEIAYQLQSKQTLTDAFWIVEQTFLGAEDQDWTPLAILKADRPTLFFTAVAIGLDTDGQGLPDWWQLQYFGTLGNDPYADPDGDGWNNLQEYQNGTNPNQFNTPPPPRNVTATVDSTGTNLVVTWDAAPGPVTSYSILTAYEFSLDDVSSSTFSYAAELEVPYAGALGISAPPAFIRANFSNGGSSMSPIALYAERLGIDASIIRSASSRLLLAIGPMPPNTSRIRVVWDAASFGEPPNYSWFEIAATNFIGGMAAFSSEQSAEIVNSLSDIFVQAMDSDSSFGPPAIAKNGLSSSGDTFVDARAHIKENLKFLLRSASINTPFSYTSRYKYTEPGYPYLDPAYGFARPPSATNYEYYGFRLFSLNENTVFFDTTRPIEENYLWQNFVYDPSDFSTNGSRTNGVGFLPDSPDLRLLAGPKHYFSGTPSNSPPAPLAFDTGSSTWLMARWTPWSQFSSTYSGPDWPAAVAEIGLIGQTNGWASLPASTRNLYGLPVQGVLARSITSLGGVVWTWSAGGDQVQERSQGYFYSGAAVPSLQTIGYYFSPPRPPVPGSPDFTTTNTSPLLIASVGQPYELAGWAKQAILNGYSDKFAYLEEYFDKAYKTDSNGVATTNETGVLSPYGEFFPTEPGPTALVTMPDIETGERGTGIVNVIKLQLDVNHDGVMDLTFGGPDNTSANHPFRFWVNNDFDFSSGYLDPYGHDTDAPGLANFRDPSISSVRDLEDFARLWICGLPELPANEGYTVTLSLSPTAGNPAVNLVKAVEADGGTRYLTETNTARQQRGINFPDGGLKYPTITSTSALTLPTGLFTNGGNKCFIFEGAGTGAGELVLTVQQGTNVFGKASAWLDLRDVKDMFEHAHADDVSLADPPTTNSGSFKIDNYQLASESEDEQLIVFVHGINNTRFDYENTSQTMFKRLYWQGYHGRFSSFRWRSPTWSLIPASNDQISYLNFNKGEYTAYQSAAALKGYIGNLRTRFQGSTINLASHSLGAIVANMAIRLGAQVDNYAMCQAAVSAGAFDGTNPNLTYSYLASGASGTPDADALGGYKDSFHDATRRVNFYNDDDWALFKGPLRIWEGNQLYFRPDSYAYLGGISYHYSFDGTNCFYHEYDNEGNLLASRTLGQDFEKKSYVARSRTKAVGAAGSKYEPFAVPGGAIALNVSLQDPAKGFTGDAQFGSTRSEHSGEFTKSIQNVAAFYKALLNDAFQIAPNP